MLQSARRAFVLIAALATPLAPAFAEAPLTAVPPAARALDPADLAVASQIIAVILPPEQRVAIVERVIKSMMDEMQDSMASFVGVDDPGLQQIFARSFAKIPVAMRPALARRIPGFVDAMTRAYVRHFSPEDLRAILAFARTPAGSRYLSRSTGLMQDPDVVSELTAMNREGAAVGIDATKGLEGEITGYLAQHPEVAKKIAAAHAQR